MQYLRSLLKRKQLTPDTAVAFGYKFAWLAVRSEDTSAVIDALQLRDVHPSTWREGVQAAYERGLIFVTPPIQGWTLAAGVTLPLPDDRSGEPDRCTPFLLALGQRFPDVQLFATHRVVEFHAWARVFNGGLVRQYAIAGDSGKTPWSYGANTPEEEALGFHFIDLNTVNWDEVGEDGEIPGYSVPNEEDVMQLAGAWSVNPQTLPDLGLPPSLGQLGRMGSEA